MSKKRIRRGKVGETIIATRDVPTTYSWYQYRLAYPGTYQGTRGIVKAATRTGGVYASMESIKDVRHDPPDLINTGDTFLPRGSYRVVGST